MNRPLARVEDLARDLMRSLRPELAARALLLPKAPSDFVTANRTFVTDGDRLIPLVGIWRDDRFPDAEEQAKLQAVSDAIDEATGLSDTEHEAVANDETVLDAVHFAWVGPTAPGQPHYYRLQGPRLLIEWDNTQRNANHAHSVWRDPISDFGLDVLARHRAAHHA